MRLWHENAQKIRTEKSDQHILLHSWMRSHSWPFSRKEGRSWTFIELWLVWSCQRLHRYHNLIPKVEKAKPDKQKIEMSFAQHH